MRADVVRGDRTALLELEITPGKSNRARINRGALPRTRDLVGRAAHRDVLARGPRPGQGRSVRPPAVPRLAAGAAHARGWPACEADYDRVLKQRNTLLKSARGRRNVEIATLDIWDENLARTGAELVAPPPRCCSTPSPRTSPRRTSGSPPQPRRTAATSPRRTSRRSTSPPTLRDQAAIARRRCSTRSPGAAATRWIAASAWSARTATRSTLTIGELPAKGYASHGESWSLALALQAGLVRAAARG